MTTVARNRYVPAYEQVTRVYGFGLTYHAGNFRRARIDESDEHYAERRARKLLRANLNKRQLATLKKHQWINVRGNHTDRLYRIDCTTCSLNISSRGDTFCVMIYRGGIPRNDHLLAQKLLIETNERKFLRIAVRS